MMSKFLWGRDESAPAMRTKAQSKKYTKDDEDMILQNAHLSNRHLASLMGRTETAIQQKRTALERQRRIGYQKRSGDVKS
jgi:hypothetical protein